MSIQTELQKETQSLIDAFIAIRKHTENICSGLEPEDYGAQPIVDVSPPKWHLGHTTWFFETFVLIPFKSDYQVFDSKYNFVFNSYYNNVGTRVMRFNRGDLTRPTIKKVYAYRAHVNESMCNFLQSDEYLKNSAEIDALLTIGLNHEQQHQELLWTDLKYILGHQPLLPKYGSTLNPDSEPEKMGNADWLDIPAGIYRIGHQAEGFAFDNEYQVHEVKLNAFKVASKLVTAGEFMEFIHAGGYSDFNLWHDEGFAWVKENHINAPMYWNQKDGEWTHYTLNGEEKIHPEQILKHISFYEAFAFARWKGCRLLTEFEWEAASEQFKWGARWEWTASAYLPYPGYRIKEGAIGEYNGKFMVNQMVLRGASCATSENHSRHTYRNFFHPNLRWQYTGIRLATDD